MIPGEIFLAPSGITLNEGRETLTIAVKNVGDRPIRVGSHYHFFEVNAALRFDRDAVRGYRLDIVPGSVTVFPPGEMTEVSLVKYAGDRVVWGFSGHFHGQLKAS
ncbi:MAG: urease subunit beta [Alphaproteobacteria bacterium]|nr:urease subunit beta [Alphaproteobacteria bacterium]MBF0130311.1 urease subunit beta [Alphaproteobacteria bacterium]